MIVLDENLKSQSIMTAIMAWYPGKVISISILRTGSLIKDEAIPALLGKLVRPTFVTINVKDFWKKARPHSAYCIVNVALPKERAHEIPDLLRDLFRLPPFKTKSARMGKIIRLTWNQIDYYEFDRRIRSYDWPD